MPGAERLTPSFLRRQETTSPFAPAKGDACKRSNHARACPSQSGSPPSFLRKQESKPPSRSVRGRECSAAKRAGDARGGEGGTGCPNPRQTVKTTAYLNPISTTR